MRFALFFWKVLEAFEQALIEGPPSGSFGHGAWPCPDGTQPGDELGLDGPDAGCAAGYFWAQNAVTFRQGVSALDTLSELVEGQFQRLRITKAALATAEASLRTAESRHWAIFREVCKLQATFGETFLHLRSAESRFPGGPANKAPGEPGAGDFISHEAPGEIEESLRVRGNA